MENILHSDQLNYLAELNKHNDSLLSRMEKYAEENKIPILDKLSAIFLEQLIQIHNPKQFLEIGTAIGYSTIRVAKISQKETKIDTIELSKNSIELAKSFIEEAGQSEKIEILEGNALEIIPNLTKNYDFIFLDADKEDYLTLFEYAMKRLRVGGIILVDNLLWHGYAAVADVPDKYKKSTEFIRKFNAQFLSNPNLNASLLPIGDGLGLGIKI